MKIGVVACGTVAYHIGHLLHNIDEEGGVYATGAVAYCSRVDAINEVIGSACYIYLVKFAGVGSGSRPVGIHEHVAGNVEESRTNGAAASASCRTDDLHRGLASAGIGRGVNAPKRASVEHTV